MRTKRVFAYLAPLLLLSPSIASGSELGPIIDANSQKKIIRQISNLPDGSVFNFRFKSKIDGKSQPLLLKVPKGYTRKSKWPLLVVLHGLGDGPIIVPQIDRIVQVGPFGRGDMWYKDIGKKDVFECIELTKEIFNIDAERIYLCGFSMGGVGTFDLGLKYPDFWAACVPVCGRPSDTNLVENGRNLPFWINTGSEDKVVPAEYSRKAFDEAIGLGFHQWKYTEYEGMGHSFWIDWDKIEKWLLTKKKNKEPKYVTFSCYEPSQAYWVKITAKNKEHEIAKIRAKIKGQTVDVKTNNVADYVFYLKNGPIDISRKILIIENDKQIFSDKLPKGGLFQRKMGISKS